MGHHNQAALLVEITGLILGNFGKALLGIIVFFACMTTAVGLASSSSDFFFQLFKEKISYKVIVTTICLIGYLLSNVGITAMITVATPMLNILYPLLLSQIILSFFNKFLKKDSIYKGAALGALVICVLQVAADFGAPTMFIYQLPLASLGLNWIIPSAIGGVIGAFVPNKD
jgi:LIVCS family branched-chain amino acid:cation transporter